MVADHQAEKENTAMSASKESGRQTSSKDSSSSIPVQGTYRSAERMLAAVVNMRRMSETRRITVSLLRAR
jgi:hypothetical protein